MPADTTIPSGLDRITIIPGLCGGKPTIRGLRITVETILGFIAAGDTPEEILAEYALLEQQDITACLAFANGPAN
jgi:uncharacterized protein (DUF433 family)